MAQRFTQLTVAPESWKAAIGTVDAATASSNFGSVLVPSSNIGPGIWTGSCGNGIFQLSVCGKQLKYCRQRETAITTTAPVLQREKLQLLRPLRNCRKRELASTTTAPVLQREKLHLLRPPQYCKKRETIIAATLPAWQAERNCKSYDRSSVAETEKLQLLRPLQIKSWKAANLEESKVGRCVVFQP